MTDISDIFFLKSIKKTFDTKYRNITEDDKKILKTHKFEEVVPLGFYVKYTFRCKICSAEIDIVDNYSIDSYSINAFYIKHKAIAFDVCSVITMKTACK